VLIRPILKKTPYEFFKGRRPILTHLKVFGCKYFILNNEKKFGKFDAKADEGIFLSYATNNHAYRVYNKRVMIVEEFVHVVFDEFDSKLQNQVVIDVDEDDAILEKKDGTKKESAKKENNQLKLLFTTTYQRIGYS